MKTHRLEYDIINILKLSQVCTGVWKNVCIYTSAKGPSPAVAANTAMTVELFPEAGITEKRGQYYIYIIV